MKNLIKRFAEDRQGATAIEYTLIASVIGAALLAAWPPFYEGFMAAWTNVGKVIKGAVS